MRFGLLLMLTGAAALFWVFAVIGILTVARGALPEPSSPPAPLLETIGDEAVGADVQALPRYPGSTRSEYRESAWAESTVTEAEFVTPASVHRVERFYHQVFEAYGWTVRDQRVVYGEHVYEVALGDLRATVEIERVGKLTEVEIELIVPMQSRTTSTVR